MKRMSGPRRQVIAQLSNQGRVDVPKAVSVNARSVRGLACARFCQGNDGQALVEMAFVLPLMMMLLLGMFSIGLALIQYEMLGQATFAGSQQFQNGRGLLGDPCASAAAAVTAALPNWTAANITYSGTIEEKDGTIQTMSASTGSFSCSNTLAQYHPATLTVSYPIVWIPIFGMKLGTGTLTRTQTVMAE